MDGVLSVIIAPRNWPAFLKKRCHVLQNSLKRGFGTITCVCTVLMASSETPCFSSFDCSAFQRRCVKHTYLCKSALGGGGGRGH